MSDERIQDLDALTGFFDERFKTYVENNFDAELYSNVDQGESSSETKTFKDFILYGYDDANPRSTYGLSNRTNSGLKPVVSQFHESKEVDIATFDELLTPVLRNIKGTSHDLIPLTKELRDIDASQDTKELFRTAGTTMGRLNVALRNLILTLHVRAYWAYKSDSQPNMDENGIEIVERGRRSHNMFCKVCYTFGADKQSIKQYNKTVLDDVENASWIRKDHGDSALSAFYQALRKDSLT